jgi:hypothetical protein
MIERGNFQPAQSDPVIPDKAFHLISRMCVILIGGTLVGLLALITGTYLLVFTTVSLSMLSLCMAVVINDRNKEIYTLSKRLDKAEHKLATQHRANADNYWDDVNAVTRKRAQSALERKRRAAENYLSSASLAQRERGYLMMAQIAAEEKAGLVAIPELRIGDAERDQIIGKLGDHYAAGRLTRDELDTRMNTAINAKTAVDLAELLKDLP